jgi:hypothetical protein
LDLSYRYENDGISLIVAAHFMFPYVVLFLQSKLLDWPQTTFTRLTILSLGLGGCFMSVESINQPLHAIFLAISYCCFGALSLTLLRRASDNSGLTEYGLLLYTSAMALPVLATLFFWDGFSDSIFEIDQWIHTDFIGHMVLSAVLGVTRMYALMLTVCSNSPLTAAVVDASVDLLLILSGLWWGDCMSSPSQSTPQGNLAMMGQIVAALGALGYFATICAHMRQQAQNGSNYTLIFD